MSFFQSYRNLSPKTRIGVGLGIIAWSVIGLQLSDRAEERFGLTPTDEDREALAKLGPRIIPVDRQSSSSSTSSSSSLSAEQGSK